MKQGSHISPAYIQQFRQALKDQHFYAAQIRPLLPAYVLKPVLSRLLWLPVHYIIIAICVYCIFMFGSWFLNLFLSAAIGHSLAVIFFTGHEIAHGCVVKNKRLIMFLSSMCFAHFGMHTTAFLNWHNRRHHHSTQHPFKDPDCFGKQHLKNKYCKKIESVLPGSGTMLSYTFLFWFFSFYCWYIVWAQPHIFTKRKDKNISRIFSVAVYAVWITVCFLIHPAGWLLFFLIPLLVCNFTVMSYLSTNHFLSPLTEEVNDPLVNSLTVDTGRFLRFIHLNFNYHTEHHIFPYASMKYGPLIAKILKEKFPDKYNHLPHRRALSLLYQRPKFYYDDVTFINPRTGQKFPVIEFDEFG